MGTAKQDGRDLEQAGFHAAAYSVMTILLGHLREDKCTVHTCITLCSMSGGGS